MATDQIAPYFHTACGHRHDDAVSAASCPERGWSQENLALYPVIRVTQRPSGIPRTEVVSND